MSCCGFFFFFYVEQKIPIKEIVSHTLFCMEVPPFSYSWFSTRIGNTVLLLKSKIIINNSMLQVTAATATAAAAANECKLKRLYSNGAYL